MIKYLAILVLSCIVLHSQSPRIEFIYNEASKFPYITTGFKLYDAGGNEIRNTGTDQTIKASDFVIQEIVNDNLVTRQVLADPDCPDVTQTTCSIILTCDVSTSMDIQIEGGVKRIDLLKEILLDLVKNLDPKRTEVAITRFADDAIGHPDNPGNTAFRTFTEDKDELKKSIEELGTLYQGNNWNAAFLQKKKQSFVKSLSALYYCRESVRKYKPVIVFFVSDNHVGDSLRGAEIISLAIEREARIYVVQIGNAVFTQENLAFLNNLALVGKAPQDVTDNIWLNGDDGSLSNILKDIITESEAFGEPPPCYVTWKGDCESGSATFSLPDFGIESAVDSFAMSSSALPELSISPSKFRFENIAPGNSQKIPITITAKKTDAIIEGINFSSSKRANGRYTVSNWGERQPPPITIPKDGVYQIEIEYAPTDSLFSEGRIEIVGSACRNRTFTLIGEMHPYVEKIDLLRIAQGAILDTTITGLICNKTGSRLEIKTIAIEGDDRTMFEIIDFIPNTEIDSGSCFNVKLRCKTTGRSYGKKSANFAISTNYNGITTFRGDLTCNVVDPLSVEDDIKSNNLLNIYPNPASDEVSIVIPDNVKNRIDLSGNAGVTIYNSMGMELKTIALKDIRDLDNFKINIEEMQSGVYFVGFKSNNLNEIVPLSIIK